MQQYSTLDPFEASSGSSYDCFSVQKRQDAIRRREVGEREIGTVYKQDNSILHEHPVTLYFAL